MENLTLIQRIIKPHTIDPLEGHTVVVFERVGEAGEEFRFEIEPGQRVPKTRMDLFRWLRGRGGEQSYFAYAVTGDPQLRLKFTSPVKMDNQVNTLMLVISIAYSVAEPRVIVTRRNDDPIRKLREEIAGTLQREIAWRSWITIRSEFREAARETVAATRDSLDRFAAQYGLRIHDLSVSCELQDADLIDVKTEAAIEQQVEVHRLTASFERVKVDEEARTAALRNEQTHSESVRQKRREHELFALDDVQWLERERLHGTVAGRMRLDRIADAATEAAVTAIHAAGGSIRTPAELVDAFRSVYSTVGQSRTFLEGNGGDAAAGAPLQLSGGQSGAAAVIAEMLVQTERMGCAVQQKQQLQSAILHLIAELLLDGSATPAVVAQYSDRVAQLRAEGALSVEHFDYLKRFVDADRLRAELC